MIAFGGSADVITFVHECDTEVTGTLDGEPFEATFIITASGDTDDRENDNEVFWIDHTSASIAIDGVGTFDFVTATRTAVNTDGNFVAFLRSGGLGLVFGPIHPDFGTWDMLSSIGPLSSDDGIVLQWDDEPVETSGGILVIDYQEEVSLTFTATVVPVAPTVALIGPAALFLTKYARRRR